jgi:hypothetical protein
MDRALERVEGVGLSLHGHAERFIVVVPADFAFRHCRSSPGCQPQYALYGESSAAAVSSSEDLPHFRVGVAREAERKPGEVGDELVVRLRVHLVFDDAHATADLSLQVLDPFFGEVSHVARASVRLTEIDRVAGGCASNKQEAFPGGAGLVSANIPIA